ncbi:hypothetical protein GCM10017584_00910 [Leifsonia poae]|uniref:Uncharacterized protein n=1 Tax=Leifsonia poae TaxID=110933 RepID=A0A9W6LXU4_9MICO|nr:hypothetical protein GCM10017584_00910 [Leifsonia poae]
MAPPEQAASDRATTVAAAARPATRVRFMVKVPPVWGVPDGRRPIGGRLRIPVRANAHAKQRRRPRQERQMDAR